MPDLQLIPSTGIGSWPGTDMADAISIAFAECPDLPYLPELPGRGPHASLVGRTTALLSGLAFDLQPAGWRLTDGSGRDHRAARSTLRSDLDLLEELAQGYSGRFKVSAAGPWTLAAQLERPRGDKVLADSGARREVAQSLAEGLAELAAELHRRLPALDLVVQVDEPLLPAVLAGGVPTASGFSRHRVVDLPEVSGTYSKLVARLAAAGDFPLAVHSCAAGTPVGLLHRAGVRALALDLVRLGTADWDELGPALEAGLVLALGALPTHQPEVPPLDADRVAERALAPLRALGLDPVLLTAQLVLTPACGLAAYPQAAALQALRAVRTAAGIVTEQLAD